MHPMFATFLRFQGRPSPILTLKRVAALIESAIRLSKFPTPAILAVVGDGASAECPVKVHKSRHLGGRNGKQNDITGNQSRFIGLHRGLEHTGQDLEHAKFIVDSFIGEKHRWWEIFRSI